MAIIATLVPTSVPTGTQQGAVPGTVFSHVTITSAGGAGTYNFAHGLQWTPTFALVIVRLAEGVNPTAANAAVGFCAADTTATNLAVNLPGNATYDIVYG
jgi:hypothetical protein